MNSYAPIQRPNDRTSESLIGLASLMTKAYSGTDLAPLGQHLLDRVASNPDDADALLDLSTILQLKGKRETALAVQAQALELRQHYRLRAAGDNNALRLLAVKGPGDLMSNAPLEFLLEGSDVALDMLYVAPGLPFPASLPDHDLMIVAVAPSDRNRPVLKLIESLMPSWPCPVLNAPDRIAALSRDAACKLLKSAPGVVMPVSVRIDRQILERISHEELAINAVLEDGGFPVIVRPIDSHAGQGLVKLDHPTAIAEYLRAAPEDEFFVARFVDYRGPDGLFRKYRIVLIDGRAFACHMAISRHWMIHYVNACMAESTQKRAEEARFMDRFDTDFASRHAHALRTIAERARLDYLGIDCGETPDGKLLIFEIDTAMVVHAMDSVDDFAYKQSHMRKVFNAFHAMLSRSIGASRDRSRTCGSFPPV